MEALTGLTNIDATRLRVLSGGSLTDILDLIGSGSGGGMVDAYTRSETDALLGAKLDDVFAGTNITVTGAGATKPKGGAEVHLWHILPKPRGVRFTFKIRGTAWRWSVSPRRPRSG